ncbi:MAG: methyltransferase domain-containing protein, partial [Dehalococcoidia bacterium]|nr:methyltransferase domain-containing protein [Dehalococcoidia bacterium]
SPQAVVRWIGLRGDETVLELGCGPGYFSIALRDATPRGRLVLFDLQPEMLRMARKRVGPSGTVATVAGNAMALPFPAETFDVVFIAAVLGEVPDREACLAEVRRVLRPGGRLVVNEVRGDPDYIKASDLDKACAGVGLRLRRRRKGRVRWTCLSEYAPG